MAYNKAGSVILQDMCPVFGMPGTLGPIPLTNNATEFQTLIDIPWKDCQLVAARFDVTTAIDGDGAMNIDLELNAAAGTLMMNISATASSAVAAQIEGTISSMAACCKLDRDDTTRDKINIEVDGSTTGTGAGMLWLFFEPNSHVGI